MASIPGILTENFSLRIAQRTTLNNVRTPTNGQAMTRALDIRSIWWGPHHEAEGVPLDLAAISPYQFAIY